MLHSNWHPRGQDIGWGVPAVWVSKHLVSKGRFDIVRMAAYGCTPVGSKGVTGAAAGTLFFYL